MKAIASILVASTAVSLAACAGGTGSGPLPDAGPPPQGYRETIAAHVRENYFDPYSIRDASISAPLRKTGSMYWNIFDPAADWYVCTKSNAKNRNGGYTGRQEDIYLFRNGTLVGTHTKPTGAGFESSTTDRLCAGAQYGPFPEIEQKGS